jgi:hypothetical protein
MTNSRTTHGSKDAQRAVEALRSLATSFADSPPLFELLCVESARVSAELCRKEVDHACAV